MAVTLTAGATIETSIASSGGAGGGAASSSTSSTKDDPLYTRYSIKTLSSNLNQIIYLLIPSLLIQYIIRLIYSAKASHHQSETHQYPHHQNQPDYPNQPLHYQQPTDQQETAVILLMINHVFAFIILVYFVLLLVSHLVFLLHSNSFVVYFYMLILKLTKRIFF